MNWIDGILIVLLLASVIVGSKKGLIREIMAFVVFFAAIIVSVNYCDNFAVWVYERMGGSPLISAFLSFAILLALTYAVFKILGMVFYKVAQVKQSGRKDQMGGALIGFLRGWVAIGFLSFLAFLLPMPDAFYTSYESSFFGPAVAKTVPLMFEGTSKIHPNNPSFMGQIEKTLLVAPSESLSGKELLEEDRIEVHRVLYQIEKFFSTELDQT
ncbi:MAG: CvpA family protein [Candidatus Zixiibacteriota bacterium]|nr:MAG: CvpA family protein [candidate division Zixibacteria bacterium]